MENSKMNLDMSPDIAVFDKWVQKNYGGNSRTKTVTRQKHNSICSFLRGEDPNSNAKFRFWVRNKGFQLMKHNKSNGDIVKDMSGELYVSLHAKEENTGMGEYSIEKFLRTNLPAISFYRKVAVVDEFHSIIKSAHIDEKGAHSGQKKTYRLVSDTYAFLPREVITFYLLNCGTCKPRIQKYGPVPKSKSKSKNKKQNNEETEETEENLTGRTKLQRVTMVKKRVIANEPSMVDDTSNCSDSYKRLPSPNSHGNYEDEKPVVQILDDAFIESVSIKDDSAENKPMPLLQHSDRKRPRAMSDIYENSSKFSRRDGLKYATRVSPDHAAHFQPIQKRIHSNINQSFSSYVDAHFLNLRGRMHKVCREPQPYYPHDEYMPKFESVSRLDRDHLLPVTREPRSWSTFYEYNPYRYLRSQPYPRKPSMQTRYFHPVIDSVQPPRIKDVGRTVGETRAQYRPIKDSSVCEVHQRVVQQVKSSLDNLPHFHGNEFRVDIKIPNKESIFNLMKDYVQVTEKDEDDINTDNESEPIIVT